jgi:hypothetical protein
VGRGARADHALGATPVVGSWGRGYKLRGLSRSGSALAETDNGRQPRRAQLTQRSLVFSGRYRARVACSASSSGSVPREAVDWPWECWSRTLCMPVDTQMQRKERGQSRRGKLPCSTAPGGPCVTDPLGERTSGNFLSSRSFPHSLSDP